MVKFRGTVQRKLQKFRLTVFQKLFRQPIQVPLTGSQELSTFAIRSHSHSIDPQEETAIQEASKCISAVEQPQDSDTAPRNEETSHPEVSPLQTPISQIVSDGITQLRPARGDTIVLNHDGTDLPVMLVSQRLIEAVNEYREQERSLATLLSDTRYFSHARIGAQLAREAAEKKLNDTTLSDKERTEIEQAIQGETEKEALYTELKSTVDSSRAAKAVGQQRIQTEIINIIEFSLQTAGLRADTLTPDLTPSSLKARDYNLYNPIQHVSPLEPRVRTPSPTPSSLLRHHAMSTFSAVQREYNLLDHQFARRHAMYHEHLEDYTSAYNAGQTSMTMTDFDRVYFENVSRLTRGLITAEENYEAAFQELRALGLITNNDADQQSGFVDVKSDGYPESFEEEMKEACNPLYVQAWIEDVGLSKAEGGDVETKEEEADEWEVREVGLSDSLSLVDYSRNRRRIERWRQACGW